MPSPTFSRRESEPGRVSDSPTDQGVSTPLSSAQVAQSREGETPSPSGSAPSLPSKPSTGFVVAAGVEHPASAHRFVRSAGDPVYRPLRIFTVDPSLSKFEGATTTVNVPFEPLEPGPRGTFLVVDDVDGWRGVRYAAVDLDDPRVLMRSGRNPSPSDPQFHQQMVYAVCALVHATFRGALGRLPTWGVSAHGRGRLVVVPHAFEGRNAYYDPERGEIRFGYYFADEKTTGRNLPGGYVFTCLSHDVVAHEVTHALLDGLRAHFAFPSGPDVLAFHEAFADLVAIFQRFSYSGVVKEAIRSSRGRLGKSKTLTDLARQFGQTTGLQRALRSAIGSGGDRASNERTDVHDTEPHARGAVLLAAVFDAFLEVFDRKSARYVRLASNGTGVLPKGHLPEGLVDMLAEQASRLASQFLAICTRAIDYCPPVDVEFGEFLRAMITADYDLVPDDPWGYREALIDAFGARGIFPRDVPNLSEDALLWRSSERPLAKVPDLSFASLRFRGDPGWPAGDDELRRQATALGTFVTQRDLLEVFGLVRDGDARLDGDPVDSPCVQSIRSSRRVGPDGQVVFDLVCEVAQRRSSRLADGRSFDFYGGSTIILGPEGEVRYVIRKDVASRRRLDQQRRFIARDGASAFWASPPGEPSRLAPVACPFLALHAIEADERRR
jgi:hypothetical protein